MSRDAGAPGWLTTRPIASRERPRFPVSAFDSAASFMSRDSLR
jgi:hypothetical protein